MTQTIDEKKYELKRKIIEFQKKEVKRTLRNMQAKIKSSLEFKSSFQEHAEKQN